MLLHLIIGMLRAGINIYFMLLNISNDLSDVNDIVQIWRFGDQVTVNTKVRLGLHPKIKRDILLY